MIMAPNGTPIPMPILAELERLGNDAEGVAVPEFVAVSVEASAVDAELVVDADDSSIVLELWESDVDVEALDVAIETCPSVKRWKESPQQSSPLNLVQHQDPEDSGGHAIIPAPPCGFPMICVNVISGKVWST